MGLHVTPEVRWIETHFCCSLSCWQMAFPSHPPAFPSCHLSFWRGHWFPRVLRFFYRRDVSPALSLCTCSASGRRVSCTVISRRLPTLDVSLPISVHLPVARQGHSLTTIKLYFCTHKGMSSESYMQQVLCSNEFENFGANHPSICTGAISSEVQQWLSSVQNTMEAMSLFGAEFQLVVLGILSK